MSAAWFVDGAYALRCWRAVASGTPDYTRFRYEIEQDAGEQVADAYYFNAEDENNASAQHGFHLAISAAPPDGPGLRVKLGSLQTRTLYWPEGMGGGAVVHPESGQQYRLTVQKEVDVLLAFNLVRSFSKRRWAKLYLVAGDKDFFEVVRYLVEDEGVDVTMFGVRDTGRGTASIAHKYGAYARIIHFEDIKDRLAMGDRPRGEPAVLREAAA